MRVCGPISGGAGDPAAPVPSAATAGCARGVAHCSRAPRCSSSGQPIARGARCTTRGAHRRRWCAAWACPLALPARACCCSLTRCLAGGGEPERPPRRQPWEPRARESAACRPPRPAAVHPVGNGAAAGPGQQQQQQQEEAAVGRRRRTRRRTGRGLTKELAKVSSWAGAAAGLRDATAQRDGVHPIQLAAALIALAKSNGTSRAQAGLRPTVTCTARRRCRRPVPPHTGCDELVNSAGVRLFAATAADRLCGPGGGRGDRRRLARPVSPKALSPQPCPALRARPF